MNDLAKSIYDVTITTVLKDFDKEEQTGIDIAYKNYLIQMYNDFERFDNDVMFLTNVENNRWSKKNKTEKQHLLLIDKSLEELSSISNIGFAKARERLEQDHFTLTEVEANEQIKKMEKSFEQVKDFNKNQAEMLLSEGSLDYSYACGQTDYMSFRLARISRTKSR